MKCINCFHAKTTVTNSRPHKNHSGTWRRRHCPQCYQLFTTYEKPSLEQHVQIGLPDGGVEPFSLSKLCLSIAEAFSHNNDYRERHSLPLAETVEQQLLLQVKQPSVADVAALTHQTLKRFDELVALQYAAQHHLLVTIRRRGRPSIDQSASR